MYIPTAREVEETKRQEHKIRNEESIIKSFEYHFSSQPIDSDEYRIFKEGFIQGSQKQEFWGANFKNSKMHKDLNDDSRTV